MIRKISFTKNGSICVETSETYTEVISLGVVLLTAEQAKEAEQYGWKPYGNGPYSTETDPPLYAVIKR
jgi:hypothetical protein